MKRYNVPINEPIEEAPVGRRIEATEAIAANDAAYVERNRLVALLARIYPSQLYRTDLPGWDPAWHNCVFVMLPTGQASWHYHDRERYLFEGLPTASSNPWDEHTTEQKHQRIEELTASWDPLEAATALLARWHKDYAKHSHLSRETKRFLETQPEPPTPCALGEVRQYDGHAWVRVDSLPPITCGPAADALIDEQAAQIVLERSDRAALVEQAAYYKREKEAAEQKLAAANAQLEQWRAVALSAEPVREAVRLYAKAANDMLREAYAALLNTYPTNLSARIRDHLAAQPAATGKLEREMAKLGLHHVGETAADVKARQPAATSRSAFPPRSISGRPELTEELSDDAAPSRTEAEPSLWCDNCEEPMDREGDNPAGVCDVCWGQHQADKAVLDAMKRVPKKWLEWWCEWEGQGDDKRVNDMARAELARRELTP